MDVAVLAAEVQKQGRRARIVADADGIVQTVATGNAAGRCGRDSFQWRLRRHLREASATAEGIGRRRVGQPSFKGVRQSVNRFARARIACSLLLDSLRLSRSRQERRIRPDSAMAGVSYEISLADASQHLVKVRLSLAPGAPQSANCNCRYGTRFTRFAILLNTLIGCVDVIKTETRSWLPSWTKAGGRLVRGGGEIEYEIFADQSGPFGAQLNAHHAFFNLAQILMYPVGSRAYPMQVRFTDVPSGWKIATALTASFDWFLGGEL